VILRVFENVIAVNFQSDFAGKYIKIIFFYFLKIIFSSILK